MSARIGRPPISIITEGPRGGTGEPQGYKRLGAEAVSHRARKLFKTLGGGSEAQRTLCTVLARLTVHYDNLSARLLAEGECRQDGEAKLAVKKLLDLAAEIRETMRMAGLSDAGVPDIVSKLRGEEGD